MIKKICGMREPENIKRIEKLDVDWMGFIFWNNSKRNVTHIPEYLPLTQKRVGVFVDPTIEFVLQITEGMQLDFIQLHGNETPFFCKKLSNILLKKNKKVVIIKAFSISEEKDILSTQSYEEVCAYFLFDTKCSCTGGSGQSFDWTLLNQYKGSIPFLLSGGIGLHNVESLNHFTHPQWAGIDLNSQFEIIPAYKDADKLALFLSKFQYKSVTNK